MNFTLPLGHTRSFLFGNAYGTTYLIIINMKLNVFITQFHFHYQELAMIRRAKLQVKPVLSGKASQPSGTTNAVTTNIPKSIVTFNPPAAEEPSDGVPATRDDVPVSSDDGGVVTVAGDVFPLARQDNAPVLQTSGNTLPLASAAVPGDGSPVCSDAVSVTGDVAPATKDNKQVDEDRTETGREKRWVIEILSVLSVQ